MTPGLMPVRLLRLPVRIYQRASEHSDELLREFALIREDGSDHVPARLLALIEELTMRFGAFTEAPTAALQDAVARGDVEIDLEYLVPADARPAIVHFDELLDEADDYCRAGDLLTLATQPESLAFRRWFLGEFVSQLGGNTPTPWPAAMGGAATG